MSLFISDAWAEAAPSAAEQPDMLSAMLPFIILFVVFYFLLIRPQSKRAKEQKQMVEALQQGDEVVTTGGLMASIAEVGENHLAIEVSEGVVLKLERAQVAKVLPKGTIENLQ